MVYVIEKQHVVTREIQHKTTCRDPHAATGMKTGTAGRRGWSSQKPFGGRTAGSSGGRVLEGQRAAGLVSDLGTVWLENTRQVGHL